MKKKVFSRIFIGLLGGIALGHIVPVIISVIIGDGSFYPCVPRLIENSQSEISAVVLQNALCALLGICFAAASYIWQMDSWNLAKQTLLYSLITTPVMMIVAYTLYWAPRTFAGMARYFIIFEVIFIIIWVRQYLAAKSSIDKINQKLAQK